VKSGKQTGISRRARIEDPLSLLQGARIRLRRVEARLQRYPEDGRLHRLRREARFRVEELEAFLEEQALSVRRDAARKCCASAPPPPAPAA
jgi:hypothetical protein